jgi:hypothetical protein
MINIDFYRVNFAILYTYLLSGTLSITNHYGLHVELPIQFDRKTHNLPMESSSEKIAPSGRPLKLAFDNVSVR